MNALVLKTKPVVNCMFILESLFPICKYAVYEKLGDTVKMSKFMDSNLIVLELDDMDHLN